MLNVKKFIKKQLNGGRLKELRQPNINNNKDSYKKEFFNLIK